MKLIKNKKGLMSDLFILIIVGFVFALFFGALIYAWGLITIGTESIGTMNDGTNVTEAARQTIGMINDNMGQLKTLSWMVFFAMAISFFISAFLIRVHPLFFVVYLLITIIAIVFSVSISNAYELLLQDPTLGSTMLGYSGFNFIYLNLPTFVTVIGLFGMVFLLAGIFRDKEQGGGVA